MAFLYLKNTDKCHIIRQYYNGENMGNFKEKIKIIDISDLEKEIEKFLAGTSETEVIGLEVSNLIEEKEIIKNMNGEALEAIYEVGKPYFGPEKIKEIKNSKKYSFYALISYNRVCYGKIVEDKNYIKLHKIEK